MQVATNFRDHSDEELLWQYLIFQYSISVGQFAVALVGLGALFFAYDEAPSQFLRILVSLVGIGGSLILWNHSYGGRREAHGAKEVIRQEEHGKPLIDKFEKLQGWRYKGLGRASPSVLRLYIYFCGLLALGWFSLFLYACGVPASPVLYLLDGIGLLLGIVVYVVRPTYPEDTRSDGNGQKDERRSGGSSEADREVATAKDTSR